MLIIQFVAMVINIKRLGELITLKKMIKYINRTSGCVSKLTNNLKTNRPTAHQIKSKKCTLAPRSYQ